MHPWRLLLAAVVILGGLGVLVSYALGVVNHGEKASALWGGVPERYLGLYTASMILSALGYFAFTYLILFRLDPASTRLLLGMDYRLFIGLYLTVLVPSSLWMPLTISMVSHPSAGLWLGIRLVLAVVGLAALGLLLTLISLEPRPGGVLYGAALLGSAIFFVHTAILDAVIWPLLFPR